MWYTNYQYKIYCSIRLNYECGTQCSMIIYTAHAVIKWSAPNFLHNSHSQSLDMGKVTH
jgi:hypothetical protein